MHIQQFLDSTYLKTATQAGLSEQENRQLVVDCINEAITEKFKLVMIRPEMVQLAHEMIIQSKSKLLIGTVISFPQGANSLEEKLDEARQAIDNGADELDFVCNYQAFKEGNVNLVKEEVLQGSRLGLDHHKVVKWIIEVAALTNDEIIRLSALIKNVIISNFHENCYPSVFVKSSTGFYPTEDGKPNGATPESIILMLENAFPLPIKAAGGVRTYDEAVVMIKLGVKRIGTSAAKTIVQGGISKTNY